jgi:DMSO/TMAO reductase YedYZ molybdopterin-dependent catalytic subunit
MADPRIEARPPLRFGRRQFLALGGIAAASWAGARALFPSQQEAKRLLSYNLRFEQLPLGPLYFRNSFRLNTVEWNVPKFDPAKWRLRVDGLVQNPFQLTHAELLQLPQVEQVSDFHCVEGWGVKDVPWKGVRIGPLLEQAGLKSQGKFLSFYSLGGVYLESLTLEEAMDKEVVLAHSMYGKPLNRDHGSPLRVIIPWMYGYKGAKWLTRIEATSRQAIGYWEQRGYSLDGTITA